MDNFFLRWLNKPKADDKSLLARFYHADRSLTAVASELDSFDGRAEPERCSRLVGRLRQGQDRVLSIVNLIMDELLGEDRAPRSFRAKFPEEVLQESLAGQLWFGAECLAAGSSIMNHEEESSNMRPLARAVTKSLVNVRNMLREQCLRHNIPNSPTLKLDINDSTTETLYESLKIFDRLFADFEYQYVSAMVPVKSEHEHEVQELICVLFSESLQRALKLGLLEQDQVDAFDPALMFSIPRLAIVSGLVIFDHNGPLNMDQPAELLSEMFRPFRKLLLRMRELLRTLNKNELFQLEKLLCTNEEINLKTQFIICDDADNEAAKTALGGDGDTELKKQSVHNNNNNEGTKTTTESSLNNLNRSSTANSSVNNNRYNLNSYNSDNSSNTNNNNVEDDTLNEWGNDDDEVEPNIADDGDTAKEGLMTADCASGFLIPNTNFGNLLQTTEAPLTDSFISSDDEYTAVNEVADCSSIPSGSSLTAKKTNKKRGADSGIGTDTNASLDQSPELETRKSLDATTPKAEGRRSSEGFRRKYSENWDNLEKEQPGCSKSQAPANTSDEDSEHTICDNPTTSRSRGKGETGGGVEKAHRSSTKRSERRHHHHHHNKSSIATAASSSSAASVTAARKRNCTRRTNLESSSSGDTSPTSEGDAKEVALALRAAGRMKFKTTENLLHRLFVCIAGVADQLQTNFASDLRQILKSVFLINTTPVEEDLHIDTKRKDSDLFEFRPSDSDVIQQQESNAGSNQSIYSTAEEVNPETEDSVFDDRNGNGISTSLDNESESGTRGSVIHQMGRSVSLGDTPLDRHETSTPATPGIAITTNKGTGNMGRSRSTGGSPLYSRHSPDDSTNSSHGSHECIISHEEPHTPPPSVTSTSSMVVPSTNHRNSVRQVESPPRWIPDGEAPRCMACAALFNPFRRRHHCRNCGGVFCSVCSSLSAPLPKYGLVKAVRVCRDCYVRNVVQQAN